MPPPKSCRHVSCVFLTNDTRLFGTIGVFLGLLSTASCKMTPGSPWTPLEVTGVAFGALFLIFAIAIHFKRKREHRSHDRYYTM